MDDVLDKAIAMHFIREGKFNSWDAFIKESNLDVDSTVKEK